MTQSLGLAVSLNPLELLAATTAANARDCDRCLADVDYIRAEARRASIRDAAAAWRSAEPDSLARRPERVKEATRVLIIAIWQAIENVGESPSANGVIACARRHRHRFTDGEAKALLRELSPRRRPDAAPQNTHARTDAAPTPPRLRVRAPADLRGVVDMASSSGSYEPPLLALVAGSKTTATRDDVKARATKLPLVGAHEERSREILALFWPRVQPAVGTTLTQTEWRKRNKRDALNFASVGRSDADLLQAHLRASKRLGSCVYSLRIVADELLRMTNPVVPNGRGGPYGDAPYTPTAEEIR